VAGRLEKSVGESFSGRAVFAVTAGLARWSVQALRIPIVEVNTTLRFFDLFC